MCACRWLIHNTCINQIMICTPFHCLSRTFPRVPLSMEMTETPILAPCIMQVVVHLDLIWFVNDRLWYTKPRKFWKSRMPDKLGPIFGPSLGCDGFPRPYGPIERKTCLELVNDNREMMSRGQVEKTWGGLRWKLMIEGWPCPIDKCPKWTFRKKIYSSIDIYFSKW